MTGAAARMTYDITSHEDGSASAQVWTNDNRDRGYDSEEASWALQFPSLAAALNQCGKSRTGCSGIVVTVWVDAVKQ